MRLTSTLAVANSLVAGASAATSPNYLGFNSGSMKIDYSAKFKADYAAEFTTAQNLKGAPGSFNAVRLYTNIQAYSHDDPIQAFEAAMETKTHILLGAWCSGVQDIAKELSALKKAVATYGSRFTDLVIGMSIGSEDLYRDGALSRSRNGGVGNSPQNIVKFINDFRQTFANTPLSSVPVGHIDTWDVWTNSSIASVIDAVDFVGVDEYPSYQKGEGNSIENAPKLFEDAYKKTLAVAKNKPVWVTETGWPVSGATWDQSVPSVENAQKYWREVGCRLLFNKTPTFWYTLTNSNPFDDVHFAITKDLSTTPLFDLSCPADTTSESKPDSESESKPDSESESKPESGSESDVKPSGHSSSTEASGARVTGAAHAGNHAGHGTATSMIISTPSSNAHAGNGTLSGSGSGSGSDTGSGSSGSGSSGSGSSGSGSSGSGAPGSGSGVSPPITGSAAANHLSTAAVACVVAFAGAILY